MGRPVCPNQNHKAHFSAIVRNNSNSSNNNNNNNNALPAGKQQIKLLLEMQQELRVRTRCRTP